MDVNGYRSKLDTQKEWMVLKSDIPVGISRPIDPFPTYQYDSTSFINKQQYQHTYIYIYISKLLTLISDTFQETAITTSACNEQGYAIDGVATGDLKWDGA